MSRLHLSLLLCLLVLTSACVRSKLYRAEFAARNQAEAREKVLVQEVLDRRGEATSLVQQVGELNRTIGSQNAEIEDLRAEIKSRIQQMGESSNKLVAQVAQLESELGAKNTVLDQRTNTLQRIQAAQKERRRLLTELKNVLAKSYPAASGVQVEVLADETVTLSFSDKALFNADGITVSAGGKTLLKPLADLLAEQPTLDAEVIAYTDNSVPKDKSLKDTWDWSLLRATNITRLLIRDYNTNANQLTPIGRGEFYPLASNATPEGRLANRRTVIVVRPVLPTIPPAE